jgi:hypothetical protein
MNKYENILIVFLNRDHQTTPMMTGNNGENSSDQHEYTNGHSKKVFRKKRLKRINKLI